MQARSSQTASDNAQDADAALDVSVAPDVGAFTADDRPGWDDYEKCSYTYATSIPDGVSHTCLESSAGAEMRSQEHLRECTMRKCKRKVHFDCYKAHFPAIVKQGQGLRLCWHCGSKSNENS